MQVLALTVDSARPCNNIKCDTSQTCNIAILQYCNIALWQYFTAHTMVFLIASLTNCRAHWPLLPRLIDCSPQWLIAANPQTYPEC